MEQRVDQFDLEVGLRRHPAMPQTRDRRYSLKSVREPDKLHRLGG
jgi:hypothetical protein